MSKYQPEVLDAALHEAQAVADDAAQASRRKRRRVQLFSALLGTVVAVGSGWVAYDRLVASRYVSTDNAYAAAETAQVTASVPGIVHEVAVTDTQAVQQGDVVVRLDDIDARLALAQAEAELAVSIRRVRGYVATDETLAAQLAARGRDAERAQAELASTAADLERAEIDLRRREALVASGAVSGEELTKARNAFQSAQASRLAALARAAEARENIAAARGARETNAVLIAGANEETHPEVALARARRDQARVNLERTVVRAPVAGVVAKRSVQVGQQVQPGSQLLAIVPVGDVHVDANFKEGQLDKVRVGQAVTLVSDRYGKKAEYHGVVAGLAGGTGSAFATIPAQNATGNWIKVVQRVPVRIELDSHELAARPLQVGLSMKATVDTRMPH